MHTEVQKRDIIAGHMRSTTDGCLLTDLARYGEAGDQIPIGEEHNLGWQAMQRRYDAYLRTVA